MWKKKKDAKQFVFVTRIKNLLQSGSISGSGFYTSYFVKSLSFCEWTMSNNVSRKVSETIDIIVSTFRLFFFKFTEL